MTETENDETESTIFYEGLTLSLKNHSSEKNGKWFDVLITGEPGENLDEQPIAEATYSEGFNIGYDADNKRVDEPDVLGLDNVENYSGPKGTATTLIKFGLEEGRRRGFSVVRACIVAPAVITIIENLTEEGTIKQRQYYINNDTDPKLSTPTPDLLAKHQEISPTSGIEYLNGPINSDNALSIHCIMST